MCKQMLYPVLRYHICPLALPLLLHKLSLHLLWTFLKDKQRKQSEYIQWLNKMPRGSFSLSRDTQMQRQLKPGDNSVSASSAQSLIHNSCSSCSSTLQDSRACSSTNTSMLYSSLFICLIRQF